MLTAEAVEHYRQSGYHFPLSVLSAAETALCRARLEAQEVKLGGALSGALRQKPHLLFPWLNGLIRHPSILDAVEALLGPDLLCWSSSFFIKEPQAPGYVSWHQDATYWGLSSPDVLTVWLALTPANEVNGCMKFAPGTHNAPVGHHDTFDKDNLLTRGQEITVAVDEAQTVAVNLQPGEASLHHVLLHHGSAPNRSADRRIGYAIRYIPAYVRQIAGATDSATLVRGRDAFGHFEHEAAPDADLSEAAVAQHAAVTQRQAAVLYRGTGKTTFRA